MWDPSRKSQSEAMRGGGLFPISLGLNRQDIVTRSNNKKGNPSSDNPSPASPINFHNRTETIEKGFTLPLWSFGLCLRSMVTVTVALYVLNQNRMLPRPLSGLVSKALFWPTLPVTVSRRIGRWSTVVDDTVVMGGAPFGFLGIPDKLFEKYGVRGVVNLCDEYRGPINRYRRLGISQLRLQTVDHFEPKVEDLESAVSFIQEHRARGEKVYVHCRAGHGRSAAVVFAWMISQSDDPKGIDLKRMNDDFCKLRNVRSSLWKQPNILSFHYNNMKKVDCDESERSR